MKEINVNEINNNMNLIDIRDNYMYNLEHIPNAINIPMNLLITNSNIYLNKNDDYYIYCNRGINSKRACEILTSVGYNVINIIGGFTEYKGFDKK